MSTSPSRSLLMDHESIDGQDGFWLPFGYYLERDADLLILRRSDDSLDLVPLPETCSEHMCRWIDKIRSSLPNHRTHGKIRSCVRSQRQGCCGDGDLASSRCNLLGPELRRDEVCCREYPATSAGRPAVYGRRAIVTARSTASRTEEQAPKERFAPDGGA